MERGTHIMQVISDETTRDRAGERETQVQYLLVNSAKNRTANGRCTFLGKLHAFVQ